jgi:hypothetical protein
VLDLRYATLVAEHGDSRRIESEVDSARGGQADPARDEYAADVPVSHQNDVTVVDLAARAIEHFVGPCGHVHGGLTAGQRVCPHGPVGDLFTDLLCGEAFVVAVFPFGELVGDLVHAQARELGRAFRAVARTGDHEFGSAEQGAQGAARRAGLVLAGLRERDLGASGVPAVDGPFGLTVPEEKKLMCHEPEYSPLPVCGQVV